MVKATAAPGKTLLSPADQTLILIDRPSQMAFATPAATSPPTREQFEAMACEDGAFLIVDTTMVAAKMLHADVALGGHEARDRASRRRSAPHDRSPR